MGVKCIKLDGSMNPEVRNMFGDPMAIMKSISKAYEFHDSQGRHLSNLLRTKINSLNLEVQSLKAENASVKSRLSAEQAQLLQNFFCRIVSWIDCLGNQLNVSSNVCGHGKELINYARYYCRLLESLKMLNIRGCLKVIIVKL
jgi:hypothetical protein